jgi:quercetin dioxygenase-like cupin family protein
MGQARLHHADEIQWSTIRARGGDNPHEIFKALAESELDSSMTFHEFGSATELQLAELEFIPHAEAVVHKHDNDEIMYVVRGEMHFGDQVLKAGSSIYIPGGTFYGFRAGPDGLRVVNFRASADVSFYPKAPRPPHAPA